jgi:hypothetical protein
MFIVERKIRRISPALAQFENGVETAQLDNARLIRCLGMILKAIAIAAQLGIATPSIPRLNRIEWAER